MDKQAKKCQNEINAILKKYNFKMNFDMSFPQYNPEMLPETVKLACQVLLKEKLVIKPKLVKQEDQSAD